MTSKGVWSRSQKALADCALARASSSCRALAHVGALVPYLAWAPRRLRHRRNRVARDRHRRHASATPMLSFRLHACIATSLLRPRTMGRADAYLQAACVHRREVGIRSRRPGLDNCRVPKGQFRCSCHLGFPIACTPGIWTFPFRCLALCEPRKFPTPSVRLAICASYIRKTRAALAREHSARALCMRPSPYATVASASCQVGCTLRGW